ncbi:MAG TPA: hypothetical protein VGM27_32750 [Acidobacteriaceae bacterium]
MPALAAGAAIPQVADLYQLQVLGHEAGNSNWNGNCVPNAAPGSKRCEGAYLFLPKTPSGAE